MVTRIPWDKYETALLIETFIKLEDKEISKNAAIEYLSNILRQRAVNGGIDIDDMFRNYNGISMQLQNIDTLFKSGSSVRNASKMFKNMVVMYKEDKQLFYQILTEAKKMTDNENSMQTQFFSWMVNKLSPVQVSELYSIYSEIESFCIRTRVLHKPLFDTIDIYTISQVIKTVDFNKIFRFKYRKKYNRMSSAIHFYYQYIKEINENNLKPSQTNKPDEIEADTASRYKGPENVYIPTETIEEPMNFTPYIELLMEHYQKGFRLESGLELKKFRYFWRNKYGIELQEDDDAVRKNISSVTIRHQNFVYLPETMLSSERKNYLLAYIFQCFSEGKQLVYYNALFEKFSTELQSERINNASMLKTYLTYINEGNYYVGRNYLAVDNNVVVDPIDEIRDSMISHGTVIATNYLCEVLSHIPNNKISFILSSNKEFVRNAKGEYFHAEVFDITDEELSDIVDLIQKGIDDKYFIAGNELIEGIRTRHPQVLERQPQYSDIGIRDAIGYKLKSVFSFNGNIISEIGKSLSMYDVYADYCKKRNSITITELNNLKDALNTVIYFEAVYENTLRISQDKFVSKDQALFKVEKTDEAIERFCTDKYISIADISHFGSFPYAGFAWNSYLLEHYVANYSSNFKLLHTNFNANSCVGAIVKRNSGIDDFNDLITDVLANSNVTLSRDDALQYLCNKGFIARRRYTGIEQLLIKAAAIRTQKG